jgi:hypothetical protein
MTSYRIAPVDGDGAYWLQAESEEEARRLVALNVGEARGAEDPLRFTCAADDSKQPPRHLIMRRQSYPASIEKR